MDLPEFNLELCCYCAVIGDGYVAPGGGEQTSSMCVAQVHIEKLRRSLLCTLPKPRQPLGKKTSETPETRNKRTLLRAGVSCALYHSPRERQAVAVDTREAYGNDSCFML